MKTEDARSLSAKAQEALRRLVVQAVREGLTQAEAARLFGVARGTVNGWMGLWEREGSPGLKAGRRGRPPCPRLAPPQAATTVRLILSRCPDQLRLPFALFRRIRKESHGIVKLRLGTNPHRPFWRTNEDTDFTTSLVPEDAGIIRRADGRSGEQSIRT